jgi:hypothetical protein
VLGATLVHLRFDVSMTQEFYMKEISSIDFPQYGDEWLYYYLIIMRNSNNSTLPVLHFFGQVIMMSALLVV